MTYTSDAHTLEIIMLQRNEGLADNLVFYTQIVSCCCVLFNGHLQGLEPDKWH